MSVGFTDPQRWVRDVLLQSIDLVAAEELGRDGAYSASITSARQLASPCCCWRRARTSRIEIGTAVIDMRENPLYMAEDGRRRPDSRRGRLQLGISRGSPEQVDRDGWRHFGGEPRRGRNRRRHGPPPCRGL